MLENQIALVTGASRGLGAEIAVALAEAGADVAVHGNTRSPEATCARVRDLGRRVGLGEDAGKQIVGVFVLPQGGQRAGQLPGRSQTVARLLGAESFADDELPAPPPPLA